jgi:chromosome segregation ATPase
MCDLRAIIARFWRQVLRYLFSRSGITSSLIDGNAEVVSQKQDNDIRAINQRLQIAEAHLSTTESKLQSTEQKLEVTERKLEITEKKLQAMDEKVQSTEQKLNETRTALDQVVAYMNHYYSQSQHLNVPNETSLNQGATDTGKNETHKPPKTPPKIKIYRKET